MLRALLPALLLAGCTAVQPAAAPPARLSPPPLEPVRPGPMTPYTPQPEGLRFAVEPSIAAPGATVTLVLHNGTAHQVGYNLCGSDLQHLQSGAWRPVPEDRICTTGLRVAAPGQHARYQRSLPALLPAGTYRFSVEVETPRPDGTRGWNRIYSEAFAIRTR